MTVLRIGRSPKSDIVLTDPSVSRDHVEISEGPDGKYFVVDAGSSFGTFVLRNGEWRKVQQATLAADEPLMLGKYRTTPADLLKMRAAQPTEPPPPLPPRPALVPQTHEVSSVVRRLAAILAADVVGYSRMMREDEEGTLAAWRACRRELFDPLVERYRGRIFKVIGDGVLVEFQSVVDAVRCAVEIQGGMVQREFGPRQKRMLFRVGINLGDVMATGGDLYGDGVNIAARLESIAPHGGICISGPVYDQVKNRLALDYQDQGEQTVKNITEPLRVYRIAATESGRKISG
jgi:class 3 adenylate cyclase